MEKPIDSVRNDLKMAMLKMVWDEDGKAYALLYMG